jgi:membrane protein implicated in regulation of membrane protease activity
MNTALTPRPSTRLAGVLPFGVEPHLTDAETVIVDPIAPQQVGSVKFMGIWWRARCRQSMELATGTRVRVVDRENLTLIVEPIIVR